MPFIYEEDMNNYTTSHKLWDKLMQSTGRGFRKGQLNVISTSSTFQYMSAWTSVGVGKEKERETNMDSMDSIIQEASETASTVNSITLLWELLLQMSGKVPRIQNGSRIQYRNRHDVEYFNFQFREDKYRYKVQYTEDGITLEVENHPSSWNSGWMEIASSHICVAPGSNVSKYSVGNSRIDKSNSYDPTRTESYVSGFNVPNMYLFSTFDNDDIEAIMFQESLVRSDMRVPHDALYCSVLRNKLKYNFNSQRIVHSTLYKFKDDIMEMISTQQYRIMSYYESLGLSEKEIRDKIDEIKDKNFWEYE